MIPARFVRIPWRLGAGAKRSDGGKVSKGYM